MKAIAIVVAVFLLGGCAAKRDVERAVDSVFKIERSKS